ncbi:alpha-2-HS-glycoprotein isoform X2 [Oreochromis niloticus]|uniref:alpha-2-HS-glycoprotein isoform X2 n=1 Tax=Oreochromis niloticus TaxID=8128 RepID=UPI000DF46835|nr:alpha-2-HS-glycoprotein isoform X2 [Oreochromis niloticus]
MRTLRVLTLLSAAVLLCSAAPGLAPLTCSEGNGPAAADKAVHHINEYHDHGYKFRLHEVQGNSVEQVDGGCNVKLQLDLRETKCHTTNPKPFEDCELRRETQRAVKANCTVLMTIKDGDATITKYECDTRQVNTNSEMVRICPDCPVLLPLNDSEGLKSVHEATTEFNKNTSNQHYYVLKEVGRISSGYIMTSGMNYYAEFALVETRCPMGSRIVIEACTPLCPDRARHAFCKSSYSSENGLLSNDCDFYPAENTTALGPDEKEPDCRHHGRRPPHSHGGPPPHAYDHGHGPLHMLTTMVMALLHMLTTMVMALLHMLAKEDALLIVMVAPLHMLTTMVMAPLHMIMNMVMALLLLVARVKGHFIPYGAFIHVTDS